MKHIPILFSTPMVQAILEGRKTMTRRKVKLQPGEGEYYQLMEDGEFAYISVGGMSGPYKCPYGQPGDILWVRETWQHTKNLGINPEDENSGYIYKCSENGQEWANNTENWVWKPSLFMKKEACRIFLKVTGVKVERLQDISTLDAIKEGVNPCTLNSQTGNYSFEYGFQKIWKEINGQKSWNDNPWVWCISFERIEKPENFK